MEADENSSMKIQSSLDFLFVERMFAEVRDDLPIPWHARAVPVREPHFGDTSVLVEVG